MKCYEAQAMISGYIGDMLTQQELREFIAHIDKCAKCREELDTFFMVDRAVRLLDSQKEESFDLRLLLEKDMKEKRRELRRSRRRKTALWIFAAVSVCAAALMLLEVYGIISVSDLLIW